MKISKRTIAAILMSIIMIATAATGCGTKSQVIDQSQNKSHDDTIVDNTDLNNIDSEVNVSSQTESSSTDSEDITETQTSSLATSSTSNTKTTSSKASSSSKASTSSPTSNTSVNSKANSSKASKNNSATQSKATSSVKPTTTTTTTYTPASTPNERTEENNNISSKTVNSSKNESKRTTVTSSRTVSSKPTTNNSVSSKTNTPSSQIISSAIRNSSVASSEIRANSTPISSHTEPSKPVHTHTPVVKTETLYDTTRIAVEKEVPNEPYTNLEAFIVETEWCTVCGEKVIYRIFANIDGANREIDEIPQHPEYRCTFVNDEEGSVEDKIVNWEFEHIDNCFYDADGNFRGGCMTHREVVRLPITHEGEGTHTVTEYIDSDIETTYEWTECSECGEILVAKHKIS